MPGAILPIYYKCHVINQTGVIIDGAVDDTLEITAIPWKFNTDGTITYGTMITLLNLTTNLGVSGNVKGSEIDNSSNKYIGLVNGLVRLISDDNPDGPLSVYLEASKGNQAAGIYPSDCGDFSVANADLVLGKPICILRPNGASAQEISRNFTV